MFNPLLQLEDLSTGMMDAQAFGAIMAFIAGFMLVFFVILIALYIYMSLALMKTAQRLKVEPAWLAWIPIGNIYLMLKMAKMPWHWMLVLLAFVIPIVNFLASIAFLVVMIMAQYKICEARQKPGWWAILIIIPIVGSIWNLIMWGILAWGK